MTIADSSMRRTAFALAVIGWAALLIQLWLSIGVRLADGTGVTAALVSYFGFFTILTNIFGALTLTARALAGDGGRVRSFLRQTGVLTAATTAIIIVGITYHFVLRGTWQPEGMQLVADIALHYVMPIALTAFWWLTIPRGALRLGNVPRWLSYPAGYAAYVFLRGPLVGDYPYFFIDANDLGYVIALRNACVVLVVFVLVAAILVGVNRSRLARTARSA